MVDQPKSAVRSVINRAAWNDFEDDLRDAACRRILARRGLWGLGFGLLDYTTGLLAPGGAR